VNLRMRFDSLARSFQLLSERYAELAAASTELEIVDEPSSKWVANYQGERIIVACRAAEQALVELDSNSASAIMESRMARQFKESQK